MAPACAHGPLVGRDLAVSRCSRSPRVQYLGQGQAVQRPRDPAVGPASCPSPNGHRLWAQVCPVVVARAGRSISVVCADDIAAGEDALCVHPSRSETV